MKAKIIIENLETTIILKPENDFDRNILKTMHENKQNFDIYTNVESDYHLGIRDNYKLKMSIKETK